MREKMLVVSAHVGDFVWRSAGTIAKYVKKGAEVHVIVLSYGARGESGVFYKQKRGTLEECKRIRREEAEKAAGVLGIQSIVFCDYEDFSLEVDEEGLEWLAERFRNIRPDFILTHDKEKDFINPDHTKAAQAVMKAYAIASAKGASCHGTETLPRHIPMFGFEPMSPEACNYKPDIYIDITEEWEQKLNAMQCLKTQNGSMDAYIQKAILRASYCSGRGGCKGCRYAESFSMYAPVYAYDAFVW